MSVVFPAPKNPEKISTFVAIRVSFFLLAEINDVVFRGVRDVEVFYLQTRDRDRGALRVVTEESDTAGNRKPLIFREASSAVGYTPHFVMSDSLVRVCTTTTCCLIVFLPLSWFVILSEDERLFIHTRVINRIRKRAS